MKNVNVDGSYCILTSVLYKCIRSFTCVSSITTVFTSKMAETISSVKVGNILITL